MAAPERHIVIAVDFEERDDRAMQFLVDTIYRPGSVINLVHVVLAREESNEIYHLSAFPLNENLLFMSALMRKRVTEINVLRAMPAVLHTRTLYGSTSADCAFGTCCCVQSLGVLVNLRRLQNWHGVLIRPAERLP